MGTSKGAQDVRNARQGVMPCGKKGKKTRYSVLGQKLQNELLFSVYMAKFFELSAGEFRWKNMGKFFDERFAEAALFYEGRVTIWYSPECNSFLCGRTIDGTGTKFNTQPFDMYGRLISSKVYAPNMFQKELDTSNSVIIYDSSSRVGDRGMASDMPFPPALKLEPTVDDLVLIRKTLRTNLNSLSTPIIVRGSKDDMLTLRNMVDQYDARCPYIYIDSDNVVEMPLTALQTKTDSHVAELSEQLHRFEAEGLSMLGIDNVAYEKSERLLSDEVNANNQSISIILSDRLDSRKKGLDRLNELFGTNCEIEIQESRKAADIHYGVPSSPGYNESAEDSEVSETPTPAEGGSL